MDQRVQELILQRPNRNEEEFFATRVLKAAGVKGTTGREEYATSTGGRVQSRWGLALRFLKRYVEEKLRLGRPFITAAMYRDADGALEDMRLASWDAEAYYCHVILARFPGDRLSVFSSTPELNELVQRYGTPLTIHGVFEREYLIQHPLESVLKVIEKEYRYDGDSPQE